MKPIASVVIPVLNGVSTLGAQIEALLAQDPHRTCEIVVADNGSTDGTVDLVRSYDDDRVRLVDASTAKRGGAAAKNRGVEAAQADIILFCDADDLVDRSWMNSLISALATNPGVISARREYWRLNPGLAGRGVGQYHDSHKIGTATGISGGAFAIRRDTYLDLGGFDEDFLGAVDSEFAVRVHLAGIPVTDCPAAIVHCRIPTSARTLFRRQVALSRSMNRLADMYPTVVERPTQQAAIRRAAKLALRLPKCIRPGYRPLWVGQAGRVWAALRP